MDANSCEKEETLGVRQSKGGKVVNHSASSRNQRNACAKDLQGPRDSGAALMLGPETGKVSPRSAKAEGSSSSPSTSVESACAHCDDGKVQLKYVTRSFGKGADLLVIEGIPLWFCASCGESYFTAQMMHELERIKALRKSVAKQRSVAVASFVDAEALESQGV
jgi:YgiT-type zinc finger domain-containing protein